MRIKELIREAISVTPYEGPLVIAINQTVNKSIAQLASLNGTLPKEEADLEDSDSEQRLFRIAVAKYLNGVLQQNLATGIINSVNQSIGVPMVTSLEFSDTQGRTMGYAQDRDIVLSTKYIKVLLKHIVEYLFDEVYSSYNEGERAKGFYFIVRMIGSNDEHYVNKIKQATEGTVKQITSTVLHELVHVIQHNQQELRGRDSTEYRSYLDKRKGEFRDIVDREDAEGADGRDDARYYDLYLSSPQEIAAFAHEAALQIIRDYGFDRATSVEDLERVSPRSIMLAADKVSGGRFKTGRNRKEVPVRKRYLKLVYQEVQRYIDHVKAKFKTK